MPFERAPDAVALERIIDLGIARIDILGQLALLEHARGGVFEGGLHVVGAEPEAGGDRLRESLRVIGERPIGGGLGRNERGVVPNRLAVAPPIERERPARQRLARIPFALAVVQKATRRKAPAQPADQFVGKDALGRAERGDVPFRRLIVVDGDEGRLAAHGQADVVAREIPVDLFAQRVERRPSFVGEWIGHARLFRDARDRHVDREGHFRRLDPTADGGRGAKMRCGGERQMTLGA